MYVTQFFPLILGLSGDIPELTNRFVAKFTSEATSVARDIGTNLMNSRPLPAVAVTTTRDSTGS